VRNHQRIRTEGSSEEGKKSSDLRACGRGASSTALNTEKKVHFEPVKEVTPKKKESKEMALRRFG